MDVTAKIAQFATGLTFERIPATALPIVKIAVRDCIGVALAGSREEDARICADLVRAEEARPETSVIGQRFKTSALNGALVNGTAAHALDFDHSFTLMGQPTAPIIPAIFSLGEALDTSGRQLTEAYIVGFEVTGKLAHSLRESKHEGWHAPSTLGSLGAAAACCRLLGSSAAETEMALGIAASMASGLVANFGTMTKPLHVGLGARNGVLAAKLARSGFTANNRAVEASVGFYQTLHGGTAIHEPAIEELGKSFALLSDGLRIKPYPCGGLTHQVIDSILEFRAKHGLTPEMVDSVQVDVVKYTFDRIAFQVPQTSIQGKFCMPYLVARALSDGRVGIDAFTEAAVREPGILKLAERVNMKLDDNLKKTDLAGRPCRVTVRLRDGRAFTREAQHAKGSPEFPMSEAELNQKFFDCAEHTLRPESARRTLEQIQQLETLRSIRPLCELLRG